MSYSASAKFRRSSRVICEKHANEKLPLRLRRISSYLLRSEYVHKADSVCKGFKIHRVDGEIEITHYGTVVLEVDGTIGKEKLVLHDVLLLECMNFNIYSLQRARQDGFSYGFDKIPGKIQLLRKPQNGKFAQAALMTEISGRWTLDADIAHPPAQIDNKQAKARAFSISMDLFHIRMAHSSEPVLHRLLREDMATGVGKVSGQVQPCDACKLGKLTRPHHPPVVFDHATTRPLQLVVMDLGRAVKPCSRGGEN